MLPAPLSSAGLSPAPDSPMLVVIATLAHELWRQRMASTGWRHGAAYEERSRTHDALAPFASLSEVDRKDLLFLVEEYVERMLDDIEYARGDDREFMVSELRPGLQVGWAHHVTTDDAGRDLATETGTVIGWEPYPPPDQALVRVIRVRWSDGYTREHVPDERDLRRLS